MTARRIAFHFFGSSFLILIIILLLIRKLEEAEIAIRIWSKIKRETQKVKIPLPALSLTFQPHTMPKTSFFRRGVVV
jgi:hypothetical protein